MKRFLTLMLATSFLISALAVPALADNHWYGSASALGVFQDNTLTDKGRLETNAGWGVTAAVGTALLPAVDVELEYAYRSVGPERLSAALVSGNWNTHSLMTNAYFKPVSLHHDKVVPYIGGGFGVAFHNFEVNTTTPWRDNTAVLAYQAMAGTYLDLGWGPMVKVGYRVFATNNGNYAGTNVGYLNHSFEVGFKF